MSLLRPSLRSHIAYPTFGAVTARRQPYRSHIRDAPSPTVLSERLCRWLGGRFGCQVVDAEQPTRITGGFDFWIYSLRLTGRGLPVAWTTPLVARVPPT